VHPQGQKLPWEHSEAYRLLGLVQEARGDLEQAVHNLGKAVQVNKWNVWAHNHYGQVLYMYDPGRAPQVVTEFAAALDLQPDDVNLWMNLIEFWLRVGEVERATALCMQAQEKGIASSLEGVCATP
jgi:tetratricopeptide (TPR) repeat protein